MTRFNYSKAKSVITSSVPIWVPIAASCGLKAHSGATERIIATGKNYLCIVVRPLNKK
jgi:hypothetical protein